MTKNLFIFPNPIDGILNFSERLVNERIEIFSVNGNKVYEKLITDSNSISLNLNPGFYLLKISNGSRVFNYKLIVQ